METTTIRLAIRDLPEHFDQTRIPETLDVLVRVLTEETGVQVDAFADSQTIIITVPTSRLLAAATSLRDMRLF
jgi:chemotaxis protein histidine kinase CheA